MSGQSRYKKEKTLEERKKESDSLARIEALEASLKALE